MVAGCRWLLHVVAVRPILAILSDLLCLSDIGRCRSDVLCTVLFSIGFHILWSTRTTVDTFHLMLNDCEDAQVVQNSISSFFSLRRRL